MKKTAEELLATIIEHDMTVKMTSRVRLNHEFLKVTISHKCPRSIRRGRHLMHLLGYTNRPAGALYVSTVDHHELTVYADQLPRGFLKVWKTYQEFKP
jgi:hypothetical protein